jgi:hypothetical protein
LKSIGIIDKEGTGIDGFDLLCYNSRGGADMTTISIIPDGTGSSYGNYRAVAGSRQSVGRTAGEALDALTAQLDDAEATTLVIVHHFLPDQYFTAEQRQRLEELMNRWRVARDTGTALAPAEQAELDALVETELRAATARSAALIRGMNP